MILDEDGVVFLYSSNRLPLFYSSCGRYQNENFHWALACYLAGEPELGWRNLHSAAEISARGVECGPGTTVCDLDFDLAAPYGYDFADTVAVLLRAVVETVSPCILAPICVFASETHYIGFELEVKKQYLPIFRTGRHLP